MTETLTFAVPVRLSNYRTGDLAIDLREVAPVLCAKIWPHFRAGHGRFELVHLEARGENVYFTLNVNSDIDPSGVGDDLMLYIERHLTDAIELNYTVEGRTTTYDVVFDAEGIVALTDDDPHQSIYDREDIRRRRQEEEEGEDYDPPGSADPPAAMVERPEEEDEEDPPAAAQRRDVRSHRAPAETPGWGAHLLDERERLRLAVEAVRAGRQRTEWPYDGMG
jgi:hypothetical protein